jgi:hypothetical protein
LGYKYYALSGRVFIRLNGSEGEGGTEHIRGIIQFIEIEKRLQFGINLQQLKKTQLYVNPHLLQRAYFIFPGSEDTQ